MTCGEVYWVGITLEHRGFKVGDHRHCERAKGHEGKCGPVEDVAPVVVREPQAGPYPPRKGDVWRGPYYAHAGTVEVEYEFTGEMMGTSAVAIYPEGHKGAWWRESFTDGTLTFVRSAEPVSPHILGAGKTWSLVPKLTDEGPAREPVSPSGTQQVREEGAVAHPTTSEKGFTAVAPVPAVPPLPPSDSRSSVREEAGRLVGAARETHAGPPPSDSTEPRDPAYKMAAMIMTWPRAKSVDHLLDAVPEPATPPTPDPGVSGAMCNAPMPTGIKTLSCVYLRGHRGQHCSSMTAAPPPVQPPGDGEGPSVVALGWEDNTCSYCGLTGRHFLACRRAGRAVADLEAASSRARAEALREAAALLRKEAGGGSRKQAWLSAAGMVARLASAVPGTPGEGDNAKR